MRYWDMTQHKRGVTNMSNLLTIKEFAQELKISEKLAYGMVRSVEFSRHKISYDIALKTKERKNSLWRVDIQQYYRMLDKRVI